MALNVPLLGAVLNNLYSSLTKLTDCQPIKGQCLPGLPTWCMRLPNFFLKS